MLFAVIIAEHLNISNTTNERTHECRRDMGFFFAPPASAHRISSTFFQKTCSYKKPKNKIVQSGKNETIIYDGIVFVRRPRPRNNLDVYVMNV